MREAYSTEFYHLYEAPMMTKGSYNNIILDIYYIISVVVRTTRRITSGAYITLYTYYCIQAQIYI